VRSPNNIDDEEMMEAIKLSMESLTNEQFIMPKSPPRERRTNKEINDEIDDRYEISLLKDLQKKSKKEMIQNIVNKREKELSELKSPDKIYSTDNNITVYTLKIKTLDGKDFVYKIDKNEPLKTLINKIRFENKHIGNVKLTLPGQGVIDCDVNTSIMNCKISNNSLLMASLVPLSPIPPVESPVKQTSPIQPTEKIPLIEPKRRYAIEYYPKDKLITFKVKNPGFSEKKYTFYKNEQYGKLLEFIRYDFNVEDFDLNINHLTYHSLSSQANLGKINCDPKDNLGDCGISNNITLYLYPKF
jgi:hypothetical protein